jgi:type VI secretion system secreted protein Hcp
MRLLKTLLLTLSAFCLSAGYSQAALNAYLTLAGQVTGDIEGDVTEAGKENTIKVVGYNHTVRSSTDAATGLPTGKRQHKPLTIVKEIDKSSPLLFNVLSNNENLSTFTLRFYKPDSRTGQETQYYTVELINARIAGIRNWTPNTLDPASRNYGDMEEVSFVYQKIIWTYEQGGITAEDDWQTPVAAAPPGEDK